MKYELSNFQCLIQMSMYQQIGYFETFLEGGFNVAGMFSQYQHNFTKPLKNYNIVRKCIV